LRCDCTDASAFADWAIAGEAIARPTAARGVIIFWKVICFSVLLADPHREGQAFNSV
jgi:hypothetical protein